MNTQTLTFGNLSSGSLKLAVNAPDTLTYGTATTSTLQHGATSGSPTFNIYAAVSGSIAGALNIDATSGGSPSSGGSVIVKGTTVTIGTGTLSATPSNTIVITGSTGTVTIQALQALSLSSAYSNISLGVPASGNVSVSVGSTQLVTVTSSTTTITNTNIAIGGALVLNNIPTCSGTPAAGTVCKGSGVSPGLVQLYIAI